MAVMEFFKERLAGRRTPYVVALLAVILTATSLGVGWQMDDHAHRLLLGMKFQVNGETRVFDIFRFGDDSPEMRNLMMDYGSMPWWSSKDWRFAVWRPMAAIFHWIDYQLWPETAALMHAHSLLWFGLLVFVVARYYRRIDNLPWVAGLAALLFAIDDAHGSAVGWLANRNVLISACWGVLALIAHDRWRKDGWGIGCIIGPALFALALLAKESAIGITAYLISYAVFIDKAPWRSRVVSLVPYAVITVIWRAAFQIMGYGVTGSALYVDPLDEPLRFAGLALVRIPTLLMGQWSGPPSELMYFIPRADAVRLLAVVLPGLAILAVVMISRLRHDRLAKFWSLGMILAVIPCAAVVPADRLLFFVGIGAMGLLARFFSKLPTGATTESMKRWRIVGIRIVAGFLVFIHLVVPLGILPLRAAYPLGPTEMTDKINYTPAYDADIEDKDIVIVNTPSVFLTSLSWIRNMTEHRPIYRRMRVLATGNAPVNILRVDEKTLILRPEDGFMTGMLDNFFRSESEPMARGEVIEIAGVDIEILSITEDNRPLEVKFSFPVPLEDSSLIWLQFTTDGFQPFSLPEIGGRATTNAIPRLF